MHFSKLAGIRSALSALSALTIGISLPLGANAADSCFGVPSYGTYASVNVSAQFTSWGQVNLDPPSGGGSGSSQLCDPSVTYNTGEVISQNSFASARALASLTGAVLRTTAIATSSTTDYVVDGNLVGQTVGQSSSQVVAGLSEKLFFNIPTASDNSADSNYATKTRIEVGIHGFYGETFPGRQGSFFVSYAGQYDSLYRAIGFPGGGRTAADGEVLYEGGDWLQDESTATEWIGEITLYGTQPEVNLFMALDFNALAAMGSSYGWAQFWDTAYFKFDYLPEGTTFRSLSGVFLTEPIIGAPEPGTLALLGLGLAGLAATRRRMQ